MQSDMTVISELLQKGNLAQAEILLQGHLEREPRNPVILNYLGQIAAAVGLPQFAHGYFSEAIKWAPDWPIPQVNLNQLSKQLATGREIPANDGPKSRQAKPAEKYLLVKSWGCGFWSDVSHVLGQLLLAELTGRIPVVHWGGNSLFGDGTGSNAFQIYFKSVSELTVADLQKEAFDFWPPKWNHLNLAKDELNKWKGPYSRQAGLYLLSRKEKVVVSDFYTPVLALKPWIPAGHHLYGLSIDELWLYLVRQYLHPQKEIMDGVDDFYKRHLGSTDFIAVHARGSDKMLEVNNLDELNGRYKGIIDQYISAHGFKKIFLMTDDARLLAHFKNIYGSMIITTDCQRTSSAQGIHFQAVNGRQLGMEVLVDAYLAAQAKAFVGNGSSNPSLIVRYLKNWPDEAVTLIGQNAFHKPNTFLHDW